MRSGGPAHLLFVYGSLKQGFPNAHVNTGVRLPGRFRTRERLPMVLLGEGQVPCIVLSPGAGHQVLGEVYRVGGDDLATIDGLERLGQPDGYRRCAIAVESLDAEPQVVLDAFVYAKSPSQVGDALSRSTPLAEYTLDHTLHFKW